MTMDTPTLILLFFVICGTGIVLSLIMNAQRQGYVLAWMGSFSAGLLILAGLNALLAGGTFNQPLWPLPGLTTLNLSLDRLSAIFLFVTGLVLLPASIFAGGQLNRNSNSDASKLSRGPRVFTILLFGLYASIALIFIAGDILLFLMAWEVASIICYLLIVYSRENESTHSVGSGYLLLVMGEAGTLAVAVGFLILAVSTGSGVFSAIRSAPVLNTDLQWAVFLLSFFGFGVKAGLIPVNFWLPRAYVDAPRAFVPILAGATLNLGLYGIFRVNTDLMTISQVGPGIVMLIIGTISALVGILYATIDKDLKMVLAHSSIENVGIIVAGFGAGVIFMASNHAVLAGIAFVAALYHLINHSLYKTLLFFGVGTIETQTGTRDMDQLGGLIKWMPLTAVWFLAGILSISALPPFNGFVSEWLSLQTLLRSAELSSVSVKLVFALCGAGLALTAALAVTCFVRVFAMSFLGMRRLPEERKVAEAPSSTLLPMAILAILCLAFGVLPTYVIPALDTAISPLVKASASDALVPPFFNGSPDHNTLPPAFMEDFHNLGAQVGQSILPGRGLVVLHRGGSENPVVFAMSTFYTFIMLIVLLLLTYLILRLWLTAKRKLARNLPWDGGVRKLLPEMTYTATGFSNPVRVIFDAVFSPTTVEDTRQTVEEHFRTAIRREKKHDHLVDKLVFYPTKTIAVRCSRILASMHHGQLNAYAAYALFALLAVLVVFLFQGT